MCTLMFENLSSSVDVPSSTYCGRTRSIFGDNGCSTSGSSSLDSGFSDAGATLSRCIRLLMSEEDISLGKTDSAVGIPAVGGFTVASD